MTEGRPLEERFRKAAETALAGGPEKYHEKLATQGKLFVRDRVDLLVRSGQLRRGRAAGQRAWRPGWRQTPSSPAADGRRPAR